MGEPATPSALVIAWLGLRGSLRVRQAVISGLLVRSVSPTRPWTNDKVRLLSGASYQSIADAWYSLLGSVRL
jgi:hypothetical protein